VAVGGYRSGKSTLLNLMARLAGCPAGFGVGHTVQACTKGLHMCSEPIVVQRTSPSGIVPLLNGTTSASASTSASAPAIPGHVFYMVDTEGLSDPAIDNPAHGSHILLFATLVASILLFNVQGKIDSTTLQDLACVVAMRNMVRSGTEGDASPWGNIPPPTLLVAIRDFELELKNAQGRSITSDEYLNAVLRKEEGDEVAGKRTRHEEDGESEVRRAVRDFFPQTRCLTLRRPTMQTHAVGQDATAFRALSPSFRNDLALLWMHLHRTIEAKRTQQGSLMTGSMLVRLLETAVECVNEGRVFTMQDAYTSAAEEQCRAARDRVCQLIRTIAKREQERCRQAGTTAPEVEWIDTGVQKALSVYHAQAFGPPLERHARELEVEVRTLLTETRELIVEEKRNSTVLWSAQARTALAEWRGAADSTEEELTRAWTVWSDARSAFPLTDVAGVEAVWEWGGVWNEAVMGWMRHAAQQMRQHAPELASARLELENAQEERAAAVRNAEKWRVASDAKTQDLEAARKELHDAQRVRHQMTEMKSELCDVQAELARSRASVEALQRTRQEESEQSAAKVETLLRSLEEVRRAMGEATRAMAEAKRGEEVASRAAAEAKRGEEVAMQAAAEAKRGEEVALQAATEAKRGEEAASRAAAEAKRGEEAASRAAAEAKRGEEALRTEAKRTEEALRTEATRAAAEAKRTEEVLRTEATRAAAEAKRTEEALRAEIAQVKRTLTGLETRLKTETEAVTRLRQQASESEAAAARRVAAEEVRMRRMTEACQELRKEAEVQSEVNMRLTTDLQRARDDLQVARDDLQALQDRMLQQQNKYHDRLASAQAHELELGTLRQSVARLQRENARYMAALTGDRAPVERTERTDP